MGQRTLKKFISTHEIKKNAWQTSEVASAYYGLINNQTNFQTLITELLVEGVDKLDGIHHDAQIQDLGAGTGAITLALLRMGFQVDAIDISSSMLNHINIQGYESKGRLFVQDFFDLDKFVGGPYDLCVSRWVLGHFANWPDVIARLRRIMKPGGYLRFDLLSEETFELSRAKEGFDPSTFAFDDRVNSAPPELFYASADIKRLRKIAEFAGYSVTEVRPLSFFYDNPRLHCPELGGSHFKTYRSLLEACFQSPGGLDLLRYFESCITPNLDHNMVGSLRVTMRADS